MKEKAFAKLNLHLCVSSKREDDYHNIESFMISTAYGDTLELHKCKKRKKGAGSFVLDVVGEYAASLAGEDLEHNLVYKAYSRFFENVSFSAEVKLTLNKFIPTGAGLGGGSSDAAALLRLLNKVFKIYSKNELMRIASDIGADVPFCVQVKPALCKGIGDHVKPVKLHLKLYIVLVHNSVAISTKEAYSNVTFDKSRFLTKTLIRHYMKQKDFSKFYNSFEKYAISTCAEIAKIKHVLMDNGALFSLMSGSGSTVAGYFDQEQKAKKVSLVLNREGFSTVCTYVI